MALTRSRGYPGASKSLADLKAELRGEQPSNDNPLLAPAPLPVEPLPTPPAPVDAIPAPTPPPAPQLEAPPAPAPVPTPAPAPVVPPQPVVMPAAPSLADTLAAQVARDEAARAAREREEVRAQLAAIEAQLAAERLRAQQAEEARLQAQRDLDRVKREAELRAAPLPIIEGFAEEDIRALNEQLVVPQLLRQEEQFREKMKELEAKAQSAAKPEDVAAAVAKAASEREEQALQAQVERAHPDIAELSATPQWNAFFSMPVTDARGVQLATTYGEAFHAAYNRRDAGTLNNLISAFKAAIATPPAAPSAAAEALVEPPVTQGTIVATTSATPDVQPMTYAEFNAWTAKAMRAEYKRDKKFMAEFEDFKRRFDAAKKAGRVT